MVIGEHEVVDKTQIVTL